MATNYQEESLRMWGLNRGRGVPTFICNNRGLIVPEKVAVKADAMLVEDYYPEQSPLGEAFGCGDDGLTVYGDDEIAERNRMLFGFDDEDPKSRMLSELGSEIIRKADEARAKARKSHKNIGKAVHVSMSNIRSVGEMIEELYAAGTPAELARVLEKYEDNPLAQDLARSCEETFDWSEAQNSVLELAI